MSDAMSNELQKQRDQVARVVQVRNGYQRILNYIIDKQDNGILWQADVLGIPATIRPRLATKSYDHEFGYCTHAKTHYTVMAPELWKIICRAGFGSQYRFYRALDAPREEHIIPCASNQFPDIIASKLLAHTTPDEVIRVLLQVWPLFEVPCYSELEREDI